MPAELKDLADGLLRLHKEFPEPGSIEFDPMEPNLCFDLHVRANGVVDGCYKLSNDTLDADTLSGSFSIDQSYLPHLAAAINEFLRESS